MSKFIGILIIVLILFGVYHLVMYYDKVQNQKESEQKQAATRPDGGSLPGMPTYQLETSLRAAGSAFSITPRMNSRASRA